MHVYLELPEGKVPADLIDGSKVVIGITLSMKSRAGSKSESIMDLPKPDRGARSRLYLINSPIEEIHADTTKTVAEVLALRSSMSTLASIFGLEADIPSPGNKLGWEALSRKVVERAERVEAHATARLESLGLKRPRTGMKG
jgi:hypothetical protein